MARGIFEPTVLDILEVRLLSGAAAAAVLAAIFLMRQQGSFARDRQREVRASAPTSRALEVIWLAAVNLPILSVFAGAGWPELLYAPPLHVGFPNDSVAQVAGYAAFAVGGFLATQAVRHLGKYMVVHIEVAKDHHLVTSGPYAKIRHPVYTAAMLWSLGAGLFFLNVVFLADFLVVLTIAMYRARLEEALLSSPQGFGLQYRAYVARTGRFLPKLR